MGPHIPYEYANVEDVSSVLDHVHDETIPAAISPGLTLREAVLNSSDCFVEYVVYLFCRYVIPSIRAAKKPPIPITKP